MAVENTDFTIRSGDSIDVYFNVYDDSGNLIDLTGATIEYGARKFGDINATSVLLYSNLDNISITGIGTCLVAISASDTVNLLGKYQHALRVTDIIGNVFTAYPNVDCNALNGYGNFIVTKSII